jgi:DNA transposition AAA+ family ATPase
VKDGIFDQPSIFGQEQNIATMEETANDVVRYAARQAAEDTIDLRSAAKYTLPDASDVQLALTLGETEGLVSTLSELLAERVQANPPDIELLNGINSLLRMCSLCLEA